MSNLKDLENQYTNEIVKYRALLEQGALTQEEYTELVEDLVDLKKLRSNLETEEDKILAEKVIRGLVSLSGILFKG